MLGWGLLCYWPNPLATGHTHFLCPLIQANCCDAAAVCDAVALLNFGDFKDCGLAGIRDADPGDDIGVEAVRELCRQLLQFKDEAMNGHRNVEALHAL